MAGVSTESLEKVEQTLKANAAENPEQLAKELFAVVDVLEANGGLRRALTDPSRSADSRTGICRQIFNGKISESVLHVVDEAVSARWSKERDLADALEHAGVIAVALSAQNRGGVEALEIVINELLTFINSTDGSAEAQVALTDARASNNAKFKLALALAGNPDTAEGQLLVQRIAESSRGLTPARVAEQFVNTIVKQQNRSIARVAAAQPMSEAQIEKLRQGLSQAYGRELKLDISVDPSLIGGLRVQVGDEIMDGSVQTRLNDLNRSFS